MPNDPRAAPSTELLDTFEYGLDALLEEGTLRDVPVLGSALGAYRSGRAVRDYLFVRKLYRFLNELDGLDEEEIAAMKERLENAKESKRVGEQLLLLLDRMDDFDKPTFLARAFLAYLRGRIAYEDFGRIGRAVDRAFADDLKRFRKAELGGDSREKHNVRSELGGTGLVDVRGEEGGGAYWGLTELGRTFLQHCFPLAPRAVGVRIVSNVTPIPDALAELRVNGRVRVLRNALFYSPKVRKLSPEQVAGLRELSDLAHVSVMHLSSAYEAGARCIVTDQPWELDARRELHTLFPEMPLIDLKKDLNALLALIAEEEAKAS